MGDRMAISIPCTDLENLCSNRRDYWHGYFLECWIRQCCILIFALAPFELSFFHQAIALAGPGSALLSYFVVGIFVYCVVITLWVFKNMIRHLD